MKVNVEPQNETNHKISLCTWRDKGLFLCDGPGGPNTCAQKARPSEASHKDSCYDNPRVLFLLPALYFAPSPSFLRTLGTLRKGPEPLAGVWHTLPCL
jgi:hypothetical protein